MTTPIAEMQAGPEMDARVVNEVMGGSVENPDAGSIDASIWYYNCINDSICGTPYYFDRMGKYYHTWHPFKPSTSIAAAWTVVEKMRERGWGFCLEYDNKELFVIFHTRSTLDNAVTDCDSMPLAICKAALMAMEREKI